jgi:hypothetical protein
MSINILNGLSDSFYSAIENPFGLNIQTHNKKIYVGLGGVINCLGYNDYLERAIGVARVGFALVALAYCESKQDRLVASGHLFRGVLEMLGSFEFYLLMVDAVFTIVNIAKNILRPPANREAAQVAL